MDSVPTAISFHYQLSRFGNLTTCSKTVLYNLQQEIRHVAKMITEFENDSRAKLNDGSDKSTIRLKSSKTQDIKTDESLVELEKLLASLEKAGRIIWLQVFTHMSNYLRTFRSPLRRNWDILINNIPLRNINFPDSNKEKESAMSSSVEMQKKYNDKYLKKE